MATNEQKYFGSKERIAATIAMISECCNNMNCENCPIQIPCTQDPIKIFCWLGDNTNDE